VCICVRGVEQVHASGCQDTQAGYDAAGRVSQGGSDNEAITSPEASGAVRRLLTGRTNTDHH